MDFTGKKTAFVYGTLMNGFWNERVIHYFPHKNYAATINDVEMYNVGGFPAIVRGTHSYVGELVVFDDSVDVDALYASMDRLEGYHESNPSGSMYLREPVTVYVDGVPVETEAYFWNRSYTNLTYIDPEKFSGYRDFVENGRRVVSW